MDITVTGISNSKVGKKDDRKKKRKQDISNKNRNRKTEPLKQKTTLSKEKQVKYLVIN